ncbi:two-component sensor histidine kinase [Dactylosporangium vinaceum]|uniref:histidine kinase n=1 Tax=Dactylosporangium vinaceum TaxID=53362 RepID=A0ABV5MLA1_9ACTN|nr:histidine kinase [Dactylosporangium vinaceum]UAB94098.1 two-component sensor histidine kinase [Dactylosporangium vinaceum]
MIDRWRRLDVTVRDLPFGLLLAALSLIPAVDSHGTQVGGVPDRSLDALAVAVIALEALPLAARRRRPAVALALVGLGFAVDQLHGYHTVAGSALPIALFSAGTHLDRHRRLTITITTAAFLVLAVLLDRRGSTEGVAGFATFYFGMALAWGTGAWLRLNRAAEAERRRHAAETARAAERTRIARELHDVVTHHVTAMVVQAESARYLTAAPERLDRTLTAVTDTGRRAIADLRTLLDVLNPDHSDLRQLVEQTRDAGQPVQLTETGPPGPGGITVYRVVQEALTNALKHAHGRPTAVRVHRTELETTVEITTDGPARAGTVPEGGGHGLAGLRERVLQQGGDFSAGPRDGGGFAVRARIPS